MSSITTRRLSVLDVTSVLDPAVGAVAAHNVLSRPFGGTRVWSVGAELACAHASGAEVLVPTCVTGACSLSRTRATVRAAGEVVERIALHGSHGIRATLAEAGSRAGDFFAPDRALAAPPGTRSLRWYEGRRAGSDGDTVLVPAGLVDYPASEEDRDGFDPGPSGAAAGSSHESALKSALLETIERDAVIVAWVRQLQLARVDVDEAVAAAARERDPVWREVGAVVAAVRDAGLQVTVAQVPTSVAGVVCVVGGIVDTRSGTTSVCLGAKASDHPGRAILGALEESFQLYFGIQEMDLAESVSGVVTDEESRLRFVASAQGRAALDSWLDTPHRAVLPVGGAELTAAELLEAMRADGAEPVVVDLTHRLPAELARAGWSVVKVVAVGYQPLRIDERHTFGWDEARLAGAERRTGAIARQDLESRGALPHPLP